MVLIYWEICLRTDFQSRQTSYTLLCRTCATLSCKAVASWHPHHCSCHDSVNPYFYTFFPLMKRHNLPAISEPKSRSCSQYLCMSLASCCHTHQLEASGPYQTTVPRAVQTLTHRCVVPQATSRKVSGALPAGEGLPLGSAAAESFSSAV